MAPLDRRRFLHLSAAAGIGAAAAGVVGYSALQPDDGAWTRWLPDQPEATSDTENGTFRGYRLGATDYTDIRRYESELPAEFFERYRDMFGRIPGPEFVAIRRFVNVPSGVVVTGDVDRSAVEGRFEGSGSEDSPFDFEPDGTYRGFSVYVSQASSLGAAVGDRAVVYGPTPSRQSEDATAPTFEAVIDTRLGDRPRYYSDDPVAFTALRRLDGATLFSLVDWRRGGEGGAADNGRVGEDGAEVLLAGQSTAIRGERTDVTRLRVYPDAIAADEADRDEWKREVHKEADEVEGLSVSRTGRLLELTGTRPTDSL